MKKDLAMSNQLIVLVLVLSSLLVTVGVFGLVGARRSTEALKTVYADRTVPMYQLSEILRLMQRSWIAISVGTANKSPEFNDKWRPTIVADLKEAHALYEAYLKTDMTPQEEIIAAQFKQSLERMDSEGLRPAMQALQAGKYDESLRIQMEVMIPLFPQYREGLQALTKLQLDVASEEYKTAIQRYDTYWLASILSIVGGLCFAILFGGFLVREIVRSKLQFEQSLQAKRDLERQLQQSQKVQALGQLTGGIAHDFNNILAAILGYANLAMSKHAPDNTSKLAKYLREIIVAGERARDLVAKMLTFTRTQPSEHVSIISPGQVVQEVESMMRHSIPSSIKLTSRIEVPTQILADAGELNQMLVNLIINARDAIVESGNHHGSIDIVVRLVTASSQVDVCTGRRFSGQFLGVDVRDSGVGIPAENMPRVFDPFFTTKDVGKGTGLGLSMVQGIMMRSEGHILLKTSLGQGTCFQLLFPIPERDTEHRSQLRNPMSMHKGSGQLIWIVDDEPALTGFMDELLSDHGYVTRTFNDPQLALAAFRNERPPIHALITDMTMPGMSGVELANEIYQMGFNIPTIFCTGFTDGNTRFVPPSSGLTRLLVKPIASNDVISALEGLLAND